MDGHNGRGVSKGDAAATVAGRGGGIKRGRATAGKEHLARKRARPPHDHNTTAATTRAARLVQYFRSKHHGADGKVVISISIPGVLAVLVPFSSIRRLVEPAESSSATTTSKVVDAYVRLLQHRRRQTIEVDPENRKVLYLDWSWQSWLEGDHGPASQQKLRDTGSKFLEYDLVFIPLLYRKHWILFVMNFDRLEYQVLDSALRSAGYNYKGILSSLTHGIQQCITATNGTRKGGIPLLDITKWEIHVINTLPRQTDRTSCGLFMLKYMQLWNGTKLLDKFSQDDIASIKEEIAVELVFSELNAVADDMLAKIMKWKPRQT